MSDNKKEDPPFRSSMYWQEKAAKVLDGGSDVMHLTNAMEMLKEVQSDLSVLDEDQDRDRAGLVIANAMLHLMRVGGILGRDIGIMMSVVSQRIEMGVDPFAPDWQEYVEQEEAAPKPEPKPEPEVVLPGLAIDLSDMWDTIEGFGEHIEQAAAEFAYGQWHQEPPDMEAIPVGRRSVFKKGVVVVQQKFTDEPVIVRPIDDLGFGEEFYVLAIVELKKRSVNLVGWASKSDVEASPMKEMGDGKISCYVVPNGRMKKMKGDE